MILDDIRQVETGERQLRKFGLLVGGVFAVLGLLFLARGRSHFPYFLVPGVVLVGLGLVFPRALREVYVVWMSLALLVGFVVSNVLLTLFFYLVITPLGLAARCFGKDFLRLKLDRQAGSYWIKRESRAARSLAEYERQF